MNPGAFRTNFLGALQVSSVPLPGDYRDTAVGATLGKFAGADGTQAGDPVKGVERIFEIVTGEGEEGIAAPLKGKVLRLVIGEDAFTRMKNNNEKLVSDFMANEEVAKSTAF